MSDLSTQIAVLETKMEQITEQVKEGFSTNSKEHKELTDLFQKALEKKAGKWVEGVLVWGGAIVGGLVITAVVNLILK